jgi:uncharacterized protein YceH (UPF0502 family)
MCQERHSTISDDGDLAAAVRDLREAVDALRRRLDALESRLQDGDPPVR